MYVEGDLWCACVHTLSRNKLEQTHMQGRRNALYMGGLNISNGDGLENSQPYIE